MGSRYAKRLARARGGREGNVITLREAASGVKTQP